MKDSSGGPAWLAGLEKKMPDFLWKLEIRVLFHLTAGACAQKAPSLAGLNAKESRVLYRYYPARVLAGYKTEELCEIRRKMYRRAYRIGKLLGHLPGLRDREQKQRLITLLYQNIAIDFLFEDQDRESCEAARRDRWENTCKENDGGTCKDTCEDTCKDICGSTCEDTCKDSGGDTYVRIPFCAFSAVFTPRICHVMSGLDEGIICGILGRGSLDFKKRITEGYESCCAVYRSKKPKKG